MNQRSKWEIRKTVFHYDHLNQYLTDLPAHTNRDHCRL